MSSKLITIYVDGTQLTVKKLDLNDTLDKIRQKLADKISESNLFTLESGDKIEISDESELKLEDIFAYYIPELYKSFILKHMKIFIYSS